MTDLLPEWYPLANATNAEIETWLSAECPPYGEMAVALPWLKGREQFDAWIDGARNAREHLDLALFNAIFPGIANVPLPPRMYNNAK